MTANGNPEHVAFSSGDISTGCYFAGPLGTYSYWPVGSGSPVGGTNPAHTAIWNADFGGDLGGGAITMTFSSDPFP
jgi:hypothetical protein